MSQLSFINCASEICCLVSGLYDPDRSKVKYRIRLTLDREFLSLFVRLLVCLYISIAYFNLFNMYAVTNVCVSICVPHILASAEPSKCFQLQPIIADNCAKVSATDNIGYTSTTAATTPTSTNIYQLYYFYHREQL